MAGNLKVIVTGDSSGATRALADIDDHSSRLGSTLSTAGKVAGLAFAAVGAGALYAVGTGLKVAASMETARIGFETMLGSGQKADVFLKQLSDFAAKTPFEFPELQQAASSLISAGIEANKVIPIMTTLGDVTSGMGTGAEGVQRATIALQQMNAAGKITGEDLNQLRDAGIPVYDLLASATGKSKEEVVKLAQAGQLGKKELGEMMNALESGKGLERFSGLMEKQSQSLAGMFSTLKDTVNMGLADMSAPIAEQLKKSMPAITDAIGGLIKAVGPMLAQLVGTIASVMQALLPALGPVLNMLAGAFSDVVLALIPIIQALIPPILQIAKAFGDVMYAAGPLITALGGILVAIAPALAGIFGLLAEVLIALANALTPVITAMGQWIGQIITALMPILPPIMSLIGTLGDIIGKVLGAALKALQPIIDVIVKALGMLVPVIVKMMPSIQKIAEQIGEYLVKAIEALAPLLPALADAFIQILTALLPLIPSMMEIVMAILPPLLQLMIALTPVITIIAKILAGALAASIMMTTAVLKVLVTIITSVIDWFLHLGDHIAAVIQWFKDLPAQSGEAVAKLGSAVWDAIVGGLNFVWTNLDNWIGSILTFFIQMPFKAVAYVAALGIMLWQGITTGLTFVKDNIGDWFHAVVQFFKDLPGNAVSAVGDLGRAVWNAVQEGFNFLKNQASNILKDIIQFFKDLPSNIANAVSALYNKMKDIGGDIIRGITDGISSAVKFAGDIAKTLFNALAGLINSKVIDGINSALDFEIHAGPVNVHINATDIPHIPLLAQGAVIRSPTLAVLGDAGDEMALPLNRSSRAQELLAYAASRIGAGEGGPRNSINIEIHMHGTATSPHDVANAIVNRLAAAGI